MVIKIVIFLIANYCESYKVNKVLQDSLHFY